MIKSTLRYVLLIVCIVFLTNCDTESILENLTGIDMIWLCPDSNVVFDISLLNKFNISKRLTYPDDSNYY